jgi:hypothetical protein
MGMVLQVLHLMILVLALGLIRCLMGDFLCQIRGYRAVQFQGMAFLF